MAKLVYVPKEFSADHQRVIDRTNAIIEEYAAQGFDLTLRQCFYQHVSRGFIANTQREYKRLGGIINDARLAGRIDWDRITDRTRSLRNLSHWRTPGGVIDSAAESYHNDLWRNQDTRVEVWIEKDALVGVIEGICQELDLPHFSCRGYTSASELWTAAQRIEGYIKADQKVVILHLGDHDPSGIDMTRDIGDRLVTFLAGDFVRYIDAKWEGEGHDTNDPEVWNKLKATLTDADYWDDRLEVRRIALTQDQIEEYDPPPNPAKLTDSRATAYIEEYGDESWELDALEPTVLANLIRGHVEDLMDEERFEADVMKEVADKHRLKTAARRWAEVEAFLAKADTAS